MKKYLSSVVIFSVETSSSSYQYFSEKLSNLGSEKKSKLDIPKSDGEIQAEVNAIMEKNFSDEMISKPKRNKKAKKRKETIAHPLNNNDGLISRQLEEKIDKPSECFQSSFIDDSDDQGFTVYEEKATVLDKKIADLIEGFQKCIKENVKQGDPTIKFYEKINYFFKFFDSLSCLLLRDKKMQNKNSLRHDVNDLRSTFMHQLPFFTTQMQLTDKFIDLCEKELMSISASKKSNVGVRLNSCLHSIVLSDLYEHIYSKNIKSSEELKFFTPSEVILEIQAVLVNLDKIVEERKNNKRTTSASVHAVTMALSHYWELVNKFTKKHNVSYFKKNTYFPVFDECYSLLSSHSAQFYPNPLTNFAREFRNHYFAHIGNNILDNKNNGAESLMATDIYMKRNLYDDGFTKPLVFNLDTLFEKAALAKDCLDQLQIILNSDQDQCAQAYLPIQKMNAN